MIDIEKHLTSYHDGGNDYRYAFSKEEVAEIKQALEFYESALKNEDGYIATMCERNWYNKAIDAFVNECICYEHLAFEQEHIERIQAIAEQLKAGGENEI